MYEFLVAALPWILLELFVAVSCVNICKNRK